MLFVWQLGVDHLALEGGGGDFEKKFLMTTNHHPSPQELNGRPLTVVSLSELTDVHFYKAGDLCFCKTF